jgi:hypothetical protein
MLAQGIVDPEPHSTRNLGGGWEYIPRWARIVLCVIAAAAVILVAYLPR